MSSSKTSSQSSGASNAQTSWYDFPEYYDLGFQSDTKREVDFFQAAFEKYEVGKVRRVLEPGCGTGRLIIEMAARGYQLTGIDLNRNALEYCRKGLADANLKAKLIVGDMTHFEFARPFDAAFNTINTFRHLLTEEDALQHLQCVANSLRTGGIYVLGLHLIPSGADFYGSERWSAKKGTTKVNYNLTVKESLPAERLEHLKITMTITRGTRKPIKVSDEFILRLYNHRQLKALFAKVPAFKLRGVYDFWYEIDEPQKFDHHLADAVFILQKVDVAGTDGREKKAR